jgi:hypothetical protein
MWSTKRKAQNVYDKAEWHHRLDEKDKVLAKDVFELWMAGLIDLDLCIRIEQAIPKRRAIINAIWSPDPATGKMTYDISADDSAHKREKWAVVGNPNAASLSEAELTAPRLWVRMTRPLDERATVPRARNSGERRNECPRRA